MDIYYVNTYKHEHERTWQGYGVRSCIRLMLKGLTFIYTPLGT